MEIKLKEIPIREVVKNYVNNNEEGVVGFDGKLNIRPKYQREFVYNDKQRNEVINSIKKEYPLNVMYWVKNNDGYEVMDGQQRTISFCSYINGDFSVEQKYFHSLTETEKNKILDYKLMIYICDGTDIERLEWFEIINIAGKPLTKQELRNAVYTGEWLTDAKRYFSKTGCPAYQIGEKYINGSPINQEYLETVLKWISGEKDEEIREYMSLHQNDSDANYLWLYYQGVIDWINRLFVNYRREMKGIDWGTLYNKYKDNVYNSVELEKQIVKLMLDDDVTKKIGIYSYLLSGEEKQLNIRTFSEAMKRESYERQKGICIKCDKHFEIEEMAGDHIIPWSKGGKTIAENCQMLCTRCNAIKSNH